MLRSIPHAEWFVNTLEARRASRMRPRVAASRRAIRRPLLPARLAIVRKCLKTRVPAKKECVGFAYRPVTLLAYHDFARLPLHRADLLV